MRGLTFVLLLCGLPGVTAWGADVYQEPERFLEEAFQGEVPKPRMLWVTGSLKPRIKDILGRELGQLRVRYWARGARSAWILEEIGKERPITTGIVVNGDRIEHIKVLIYRESRGFEVRYPFFTDQFKNAELTEENRLNQAIDGISGATLSVHALKRLAALALYLHQQARDET